MSTITNILGTDNITDSRSVINTNFTNLNIDKLEASDIVGKQNILSEGAFVNGDKTKLDNIEEGAEVNALNDIIAGTNITIDKTDPLNPIINSTGGGGTGSGDVVGPASAVNNNFASFDGITGKLIKDSGLNSSSFAPALGVDDNYVTDAEKIVIGNTSGTNTGDNAQNTNSGLVHTTGDETIGGTKTFSSNIIIPDDNITFAKIQNITTSRILGRNTAGTGDIEEIQSSQIPTMIGLGTSDNPEFNSVNIGHPTDTTLTRVSAGVVAIEGVNIVKAGSVTTSGLTQNTGKLLGRNTAGSGAIEEITLGTNLSMTGTTLNATGGGGGITTADVYIANRIFL